MVNSTLQFSANRDLKVVGWLKKYQDSLFSKVLTRLMSIVNESAPDKLNYVVRKLKTASSDLFTSIRYLPSITSSQVWDAESVINMKDSIPFDPLNTFVPASKRLRRVGNIKENLSKLVPTNEKWIWQLYLRDLKTSALNLWKKHYPQIPFPFPTNTSEWNACMTDTTKGLLFFMIAMSHLQFRTKGNKERQDKNFYPAFALGEGKTQDIATYFAKFVIFYVSHRTRVNKVIPGVSRITFPDSLKKVVKDNSYMTDNLFVYLSSEPFVDFSAYWKSAKAYEETDSYFEIIFKVSSQLIN
jgi:hypothetical protein